VQSQLEFDEREFLKKAIPYHDDVRVGRKSLRAYFQVEPPQLRNEQTNLRKAPKEIFGFYERERVRVRYLLKKNSSIN